MTDRRVKSEFLQSEDRNDGTKLQLCNYENSPKICLCFQVSFHRPCM